MRSGEEVFGDAMVWSKVCMRSRRGGRNGRKSREKRSHSTPHRKGNGGGGGHVRLYTDRDSKPVPRVLFLTTLGRGRGTAGGGNLKVGNDVLEPQILYSSFLRAVRT